MARKRFYTGAELARRYDCSRPYIVQETNAGRYLAPTHSTISGAPLWSENAVLEFEKSAPRWAARVRDDD